MSTELKKELLRLLEIDEEFRLAVAAKLGLREILEELRKLREDFNKLYAKSLEHDKRFEVLERKLLEHDKRFEVIEKKLLEHDKRFEAIERKLLEHDKRFEAIERKLLEHDKRFEVIERKLLEHDKRFEAIERKLLEHDKRFEAIERKLLEHDKRFEAIERKLLEHDKRFETIEEELKKLREDFNRHVQESSKRFEAIERKLEEHDRKFNEIIKQIKKIWEVLADHSRRLNRIELVLGVLTESFYSKAVWDDLREVLVSRGETIVSRRRRFRIDENEIDLLVETNKAIYVVEVKIRPKHEDVGRLLAKAELVSKRMGKPVVPILAGALIPDDVEEYAVSKGVEVYRY